MFYSKISRRRMMQIGFGAATAGVVPVFRPLAYASRLGTVNRDFDIPVLNFRTQLTRLTASYVR
jgi:hypothetical protein